jgi:hypothetical protein
MSAATAVTGLFLIILVSLLIPDVRRELREMRDNVAAPTIRSTLRAVRLVLTLQFGIRHLIVLTLVVATFSAIAHYLGLWTAVVCFPAVAIAGINVNRLMRGQSALQSLAIMGLFIAALMAGVAALLINRFR